jgi:hypothetical protein
MVEKQFSQYWLETKPVLKYENRKITVSSHGKKTIIDLNNSISNLGENKISGWTLIRDVKLANLENYLLKKYTGKLKAQESKFVISWNDFVVKDFPSYRWDFDLIKNSTFKSQYWFVKDKIADKFLTKLNSNTDFFK